jgi:hypothetical protein
VVNFSGIILAILLTVTIIQEDVEVVHTVLETITIAIHFIKYIILEVCVCIRMYVCTIRVAIFGTS